MISEVELSEVCEIRSGGTPSRGRRDYYGGNIPWAKIGDFEGNDQIVETKEYLSQAGLQAIRGRLFPTGTLLFAIYGSMGKMAFAGTELTTNQAILGIQPRSHDTIHLRYLYYYLNHRILDFQNDGRGVAQKNLSANYLRSLKVPLPPIDEQRRIAALLDKADAIRRKREQAHTLADDLMRSAFLEIFGDPIRNPRGWTTVPLGSLLRSIDSGQSPRCRDRPAAENEWGVLKVSAVSSTVFKVDQNKAVFNDYTPLSDHLVKKGDLLFSRKNTYDLVGASAIVEDEIGNLALPDLIFRLVPNDTEQLKIPYLWSLLVQPSMREQLRKIASGAAASMPNIGKGRLAELNIPVPPEATQSKFSRFYEKNRSLARRLQKDAGAANRIFFSLSQRAFRGEL